MRILLLGKTGQLGWEAQRALAPLGEVYSFDYPEVDFRNPDSLASLVKRHCPQVIYNAAAYTQVDKAESDPELARLINQEAAGALAEAAVNCHAALLHFSTDYVFDGKKGAPYSEGDPTAPLNVYGSSKLAGEEAVLQSGAAALVLRTAWVYSNRRDSFVSKVLEWSRRQPELKVVSDQVSNPTWARMLAEITALLLAKAGSDPCEWLRPYTGVYHLAGAGHASRFDWAQEILANDPQPELRTARQVLPACTNDFPSPADRPLFSALDCSKFERAFDLRLPDWKLALKLAMS